jgi:hypothetical protein
MKVSTVMNALPRYTCRHWLEDLRTGAEMSFQAQALPFDGRTPLPANTNLIRNRSGGAINTQKIELHAACLGMKRTAWLCGADAEYIGLALKNGGAEKPRYAPGDGGYNPVLVLAKIRGRKADPLDGHYAYFIDQFTEASMNRCAAYAGQEADGLQEGGGGEPVRERRSRMARAVLCSLQDYDSGLSRRDSQARKRANIRENSKSGTAGFSGARNAYQAFIKTLTPTGKTIFNRIRTMLEKQETAGEGGAEKPAANREVVYAAFHSLLEHPRTLSKIWFDAAAFTRGLTSPRFEPEAASLMQAAARLKEAGNDR